MRVKHSPLHERRVQGPMRTQKSIINSHQGTSEDFLEKSMHKLTVKESVKVIPVEKEGQGP